MQEAVERAVRAVAPQVRSPKELVELAIGLDRHEWSKPVQVCDCHVGTVCRCHGLPMAWPVDMRPAS